MNPGRNAMRVLAAMGLVLVGIGGLGMGALGQTPEEFASARWISLPYSEGSEISSDEDSDYYVFEIPAASYGMEIAIDIDAESLGSDLDSTMTLYDDTGFEIAYADDTDGIDPALEGPLTEGVYYIEVQGYSGSTGPYTLTVDAVPIEPQVIDLPFQGTFDPLADEERDIFAFEAAGAPFGMIAEIDIDGESSGSDLDSIVYLYDEDWRGIDYNDDSDGVDPYLAVRVLEGMYYIVVEAYSGSTGPYALAVDVHPIEPYRIGLPYSGQSDIAVAYETDLYLVELRTAATIVIDIDAESAGSDLDSYLTLYDEDWTDVATDDDTDGSDSYIKMAIEAGIYLIEVKGYGSSTGDYTLIVRTDKK